MSERETTTITTPGGHTVVLKAYLTGREALDLKEMTYSALKLNMHDVQSGKVDVGDISGQFLIEQEKKAFGILLVSVDSETNAPLEALLQLPASEYAAVKAEIDKITNPTTPAK